MKKTLLSLVMLAAIGTDVFAQSSVTIDGMIDLGFRTVRNDGSVSRNSLSKDGINPSRLRIGGLEDLGGQNSALFLLDTEFAPDTGTQGNPTKFWNRRSYVGLSGPWGEIKLGRDYTPQYWNFARMDPMGNLGIGNALNVLGANYQLGGNANFVRADNSIQYSIGQTNIGTPDGKGPGGFFGQVMYAFDEGATTATQTNGDNKVRSARLGYALGPLTVVGSFGKTTIALPVAAGFVAGGSEKISSVGAIYDFSVVRFYAQYGKFERINNYRVDFYGLGATIPVATLHELRLSYNLAKMRGDATAPIGFRTGDDASQIAAQFIYRLSKRTSLYSTLAYLSNKGGSTRAIAPNTVNGGGPALPTAGGASRGFEAGISHTF